jgi:hypothetical protein
MHLLEVALQGVRGFPPALRLPLQPGYVVLRPQGGEAAPLGAFLTAVLHADGRGAEAAFSAQKDKPGKVALSLVGDDGQGYRLVRELGGKGALQRVRRTPDNAQALETLAADAPGILQGLRGPIGLSGRSAYEELFVLAGAQRPSVRVRAKAAAAAGPGLGGGSAPVAAATDVLAARSRLVELERELGLSRELAELQFEADGVEREFYDVGRLLEGSPGGPRQALADAEAALARAPTPASLGLPDDILQRVQRYPAALRRRDDALSRLQAERLKDRAAPPPTGDALAPPLKKDWHFFGAVALGLALLVAGAVMREGALRYLPLLSIALYGYAATRALRFVEVLEHEAEKARREAMISAREKKAHEEFEADVGVVETAMEATYAETPEELVAQLGEYSQLSAEVARLRAEVAAEADSPALRAHRARHAELQARLSELNRQLEAKGGGVRDVRDVERELQRVRDSIALAEGGAASDPMAGLHDALQDPCPGLLALAGELVRADPAAMGGLVRERLQQYFAALTDKRYGPVEFAPDGKASVHVGAHKVPVTQLPPKDLDLLYLSLRLTLVEKLAGAKRRLPLVVEDAFGSLDEAKWGLLARMLKHLATLTQVLHVTAHPAFVSEHTASL